MARQSILHLRVSGAELRSESRLQAESTSAPLAEFCSRTTPAWELTPGGAYLDLTGTERLYGRGVDGAARIVGRARAAGPVQAAGTAPTRLAARLASWCAVRSGGGILAVLPAHVADFLGIYPVDFLPGERSVIRRLRQLGVRTLGDLQIFPKDLLRSVFGDRGTRLADEAWGRSTEIHAPGETRSSTNPSSLQLVVGVRLARPVSSFAIVSALRRGLSVRAMTLCQGSPGLRGRWRLTAIWPEGGAASSWITGPDHSGWKSWFGLVEYLWEKLPSRRKGLLGFELAAYPPSPGLASQGHLFPDDEADSRLAEVMRRSRLGSGPWLAPACEDLLGVWGVEWYGPGAGMSKPGQGFG